MTFICCVSGCGENGTRILHSFPKNEDQCQKWITATWCFFLNKTTAWKSHYKVCRRHFKPADFKNWNLLKKGVVPSRMLPHSVTMEHDYCLRNSITADENQDKIKIYKSNQEARECRTMQAAKIGCGYDCSFKLNIGEDKSMEIDNEESGEKNRNDEAIQIGSIDTGDGSLMDGNCRDKAVEIDWKLNDAQNTSAGEIVCNRISNTVGINNSKWNECLPVKCFGKSIVVEKHIGKLSTTQNNSQPSSSRIYDPIARKMRYLSNRNKELAKRLKESQAACLKSTKKSKAKKKIDAVLKTLGSELPPEQFDFIKLQIKNTGKSKKGNRFSFEEKTLALIIYRKSPKLYIDLRKMANFPSRQTLIVHSAAIRLKEGINDNLMQFIKAEVSLMGEQDKVCAISWDEMCLKTNLTFDYIRDYIDGFEDIGTRRSSQFATHALVFMVRGVKSPFKQPFSYFLTENIKGTELAELIKLAISAVMNTGLKIIGSVCDAANTNRAAVNKLINPKWRKGNTAGSLLEYTIHGSKIWHIFDPPHIIKSVRNNLLVKNLKHTVSFNELKFKSNGKIIWNEKNKKLRTASWKDVVDFYHLNNSGEMFNLIEKISEEHINPTRKMKVSLATQVLSGTFGRNMYLCSKRKQFSNDCIGTAAILLFFNELFDSVNGDSAPIAGKLIGSLSKHSNHFAFWDYASRMLDTMKFSENLLTGKPNKSSVCKDFIPTLRGLRQISEYAFELGIETIGLRRLNQDGLENHFFKICNYCGSNQRPNARDFRSSYTTSILNSQLTSHSLNANCEPDVDAYMLQNLQTLFTQAEPAQTTLASDSADGATQKAWGVAAALVGTSNGCDDEDNTFCEDEAMNCLSRKICITLLKKFKCTYCSGTVIITDKEKSRDHDIMLKQSFADAESLPSVKFMAYIKIIVSDVKKMLPVSCAEKNLTKTLLSGLIIVPSLT
ncbi:DNA transposase THAP9 [Pseudolycoriella hygida]|uniref:DNA transposase THAP9 n=1 Tax=Pseudolycoriella hygida TaxID=35572 RepID=A0A9Q0NF08_9DIPT|nr:DNA transposase THAP9 [Pseudolycoriella hygida]